MEIIEFINVGFDWLKAACSVWETFLAFMAFKDMGPVIRSPDSLSSG